MNAYDKMSIPGSLACAADWGCWASTRKLSAGASMAAIHISATNSSTDIPAARISARSVPGAISRCCGTGKLAECPGLMRTTWLPRWRSLTHPALWKIRTARSPETEGKAAISSWNLNFADFNRQRHAMSRARFETPSNSLADYLVPRPPCVPARCSLEWKGTLRRACRSHRAPASQAASYLNSTAAYLRRAGGLSQQRRGPCPELRCDCAVTSEACSGISARRRIPTGLKHGHLNPTELS